jgi:hypothetical protein
MLKKLLIILLLLLLSGCKEASNLLYQTVGTKTHNYEESSLTLKECKLNKAINIVLKDNKNSLLKNSELGLGNYFKKNYQTSNHFFDLAIDQYRVHENNAIFDVSAFLKKEYQLEGYDKVLLHNYKAINYLLLGDAEAARVEAKNSNIIQNSERKKLNIFKEEHNKKSLNSHIFSRYEKLFSHVEAKHNPYQNPFAYYISALAYAENEEYEHALIDIHHAKKLMPNSKILQEKEKQYQEQNSSKYIELFFDVGQAPFKTQVALKLNMENGEERMAYLPSFHLEISDVESVYIKNSKGEEVARTSLLSDINAIKINEFREKLPSILYLISEQLSISLALNQLESNSKIISGIFNTGATIYGQNTTATWSFLPQKTLVLSFVPQNSETYTMVVLSKNGETLDKKLLTWELSTKTKNIYKNFIIRSNKICNKLKSDTLKTL